MAKLNGKEILLAALQGKDGKSAYEIWLEQGNTGTEADFLESLKGSGGDIDTSQFVKSTTLTNRVYVRDHEKDNTLGYSTAVQGGYFVIRGWDGNIALTTDESKYLENSAVPKQYVDSKMGSLYQHTIKVKNASGAIITFKMYDKFSTMYTSIDSLKNYLTLPDMVAGIPCSIYDQSKTPSFHSGIINSAIDAGSGSLLLQIISNSYEPTSGSTIITVDTLVMDSAVEL